MLTGTLTPVPVAPYIAAIKTAKQKQIKTERQDKNKREKRSTMMFGKRTGEAPEPLPWNGVEFRINALALVDVAEPPVAWPLFLISFFEYMGKAPPFLARFTLLLTLNGMTIGIPRTVGPIHAAKYPIASRPYIAVMEVVHSEVSTARPATASQSLYEGGLVFAINAVARTCNLRVFQENPLLCRVFF